MEDFKPDPEFWKKSTYSTLWRKHRKNVQELNFTLLQKFPELNGCIKEGLGAKTDEWLKIPPDEKNEPDLNLFKEYNCFCYIEISGSDKVFMPNNIWIRPAKIDEAEKKKYPYFFYMVYKNEKRIVDIETAKKYRNNIKIVHIKKHPETGKPIPEKYCEIPYEASKPIEEMFNFIENSLK